MGRNGSRSDGTRWEVSMVGDSPKWINMDQNGSKWMVGGFISWEIL
jgi:hypothetical protein